MSKILGFDATYNHLNRHHAASRRELEEDGLEANGAAFHTFIVALVAQNCIERSCAGCVPWSAVLSHIVEDTVTLLKMSEMEGGLYPAKTIWPEGRPDTEGDEDGPDTE